MKNLEINQMSNLQGGGRGGCFAAMTAYGTSIGLLHNAKTKEETEAALGAVASAFAATVAACEDQS
jgi:hypothetical protein